jgi:hypothetical protein
MSTVTRVVLIFAALLLIWGGVFTLIYFYNSTGTATTTQTTSTTTTSTKPALSQDELKYIQSLSYYDQMVAVAANKIDNLLANSQISDATWAQSVADNAGLIVAYNSAVSQIPTPNSAAIIQIQTIYLYGMGYYNTAVQTAVDGINKANATYLSYASAFMEAGTKARIQAITLLNDYIASFN